MNISASAPSLALVNAALHQLSEAETLEDLSRQVSSVVPQLLGAGRAFLIFSEPDQAPPSGADYPLEPFRKAVRTGETVVVSPGSEGLGEASFQVFAPLFASGQACAVLYVEGQSETGPVASEAVQAVEILAHHAGAVIENKQLSRSLEEVNQSKSKFVSVVTHELRIPMTSIKGYTDLLLSGAVGAVNDQQKNFLGVVRNNVERMSALVSDLSDINRADGGRLALSLKPTRIPEVVDDALLTWRGKFAEKNQVLDVQIEDGLPELVTDPARAAQILGILVSNAWRYTPEGGEIKVSACMEEGGIRVEVNDNGIGISPDDQAHLFTQFFRSEDPNVREQIGWGLGLSVAQKLIELMGGEIGAASQFGKGSQFWFKLYPEER